MGLKGHFDAVQITSIKMLTTTLICSLYEIILVADAYFLGRARSITLTKITDSRWDRFQLFAFRVDLKHDAGIKIAAERNWNIEMLKEEVS